MRWKVLAAILSLLVFPATLAAIITLPELPTPGEIVYYFLTDLNEGHYFDYYPYPNPLKYVSEASSSRKEHLWYLRAKKTCGGYGQKLYIVHENVEGKKAQVKVRVVCANGADRQDTYHLVLEDGLWRIDLSPWQRQMEAGLKEMERNQRAAFEERLRAFGRSREPENQKMPPRKKRSREAAAEKAPEPE